jgi:uncharacterized Tic20 family protein
MSFEPDPNAQDPNAQSELPNFQQFAAADSGGPPKLRADEKEWAFYAHISALIGIPLLGFVFIGPLVVWKTRGDTSAFVAANAKEALNFQLNVFVVFLLALLPMVLTVYLILIPLGVLIVGGVLAVMAAQQAGEGKMYRYPWGLRVLP